MGLRHGHEIDELSVSPQRAPSQHLAFFPSASTCDIWVPTQGGISCHGLYGSFVCGHAVYYTKSIYNGNPFLPVLPHGVSRVSFS